jgi:Uma2 family endonuclease
MVARTLTGPTQTAPPTLWPEQGKWTYEDWLRLSDDGFRYEILNGELYMSPPPTTQHQDALLALAAAMRAFAVSRRLGKVLTAPCGVRLAGQPVPVQPDILFVSAARKNIIGKEYVEGAPDLVVEILSPSNWAYDRREKFAAYQEAGVAEYWIVDYRLRTVEVFHIEEGAYALIGKYGPGETARSVVLSGLEILSDDIFAE